MRGILGIGVLRGIAQSTGAGEVAAGEAAAGVVAAGEAAATGVVATAGEESIGDANQEEFHTIAEDQPHIIIIVEVAG